MTGPSAAAITVLGSINMDLVFTSAVLPKPGQTLLGRGFRTIPGGKGANQAIAAATAGGRVHLIGAVGDDAFGDQLRANLVGSGVDDRALRQVPGASGVAGIMVDDHAQNFIVVVAGANGWVIELTVADRAMIADSAMLICQLEIPLATVLAGAEAAAGAGKALLLNPSPVRRLPPSLLADTALLVLNEGEAEAIGGAAMAAVPHVITTLGAAGAHYRGPAGEQFAVPAPTVDAVDTTGAGDAFTGALAVAWVEGKPALSAVQWACAAGALATTVAGASVSAPARVAIDELVRRTF